MTTPVFLGYDRQALDREYDNRAKVPDATDYLARYARASAAARRALPARLDLPYGPSPAERLDLFWPGGPPPPGAPPAPVHVFIHGGYWRALDKADFSFVARALAPAGALVAVINYALIPTVDMAELVRQCRAAVAWLYREAPAFGGDARRLTVSGHSAGGHLTAMLMATDWPAFAGLPPDVVRAGCGISGLYDLEPIRLCYLNDTLGLTPEAARRYSPIHLRPASSAPLLLPVGALEGPEYHRQTEALAAAWQAHGVACEIMDMPGHHHFSIVCELEDPESALGRALRRLVATA